MGRQTPNVAWLTSSLPQVSRRTLTEVSTSAISVVLGICAAVYLFGPVLNPTRVEWLFGPRPETLDASTSTLGWLYFNRTSWSWPLGANPQYGGDVANSLLFSDSVPALASITKLLLLVGPEATELQILGPALVLCMSLQSLLTYLILRRLQVPRLLSLISVPFALLLPGLLLSWSIASLMWQWLILAAILVCLCDFRPSARLVVCAFALLVSTGVSLYFTLILLTFFCVDIVIRFFKSHQRDLLAISVVTFAMTTLFGVYIWGGFQVPLGSGLTPESELGRYSASLLSLIDSDGFSLVVSDFPGGYGTFFVGLGALALLLIAFGIGIERLQNHKDPAQVAAQAWNRHRALFVVWAASLLLAMVSVLPTLTAFEIDLRVPLPTPAEQALSVFRANGRFMWPLMYTSVLTAIAVVSRLRPPVGGLLLCSALLLQIFDSTALFGFIRDSVVVASSQAPLYANQLELAIEEQNIEMIEVIPAYPYPLDVPFRDIGLAAVRSGIPLDSVGYFNRYDRGSIVAIRGEQDKALVDGEVTARTLYIVQKGSQQSARLLSLGAVDLIDLGEWSGLVRPQGP
jgi:hypothetical protein